MNSSLAREAYAYRASLKGEGASASRWKTQHHRSFLLFSWMLTLEHRVTWKPLPLPLKMPCVTQLQVSNIEVETNSRSLKCIMSSRCNPFQAWIITISKPLTLPPSLPLSYPLSPVTVRHYTSTAIIFLVFAALQSYTVGLWLSTRILCHRPSGCNLHWLAQQGGIRTK
jgi:hypothetical protein